jgi:uncharacterized OB-fold protein
MSGDLQLLRCAHCGHVAVPPREVCGKCWHQQLEPMPSGGNGTIVSSTVIRRPPLARRDAGPYVVAMVRLAEGPFITGNIPQRSEPIAAGTQVRVTGLDGSAPVFACIDSVEPEHESNEHRRRSAPHA